MAEDKRFQKVYSQGVMDVAEIWVDRETGVNYLFRSSGNAGGLTPSPEARRHPRSHPGKQIRQIILFLNNKTLLKRFIKNSYKHKSPTETPGMVFACG